MADAIKDRDNKDAEESGRPVQLDREQGEQHDEEQQEGGTKHGERPAENR